MWPKKRTFEGIHYSPQLMGIHQSGVITPPPCTIFFFYIVKFFVVLFGFFFFLISGEAHCGGQYCISLPS